MFEHHLERRKTLDEPTHVLVDEDFLAIEDIDVAAGDFTVDQQGHPDFGHGLDRWEDLVDAGDTGVRVGCRAGRIQLGGVHETAGLGGADFVRGGAVGQVEHHQRFKAAAGRAHSENALAVGVGFSGIAHRWYQVGHDDRATKGARDIRDSIGQRSTIAKMNMPVVGTQQGQAVGHWGFQAGQTHGNATGKDSCRHSLSSFVGRNRYHQGMP